MGFLRAGNTTHKAFVDAEGGGLVLLGAFVHCALEVEYPVFMP